MNIALQKMGEAIYKTGLKKGQLIVLIAEMNGVKERQVYNWLAKGSDVEAGRIMASLKDIIDQHKEEMK